MSIKSKVSKGLIAATLALAAPVVMHFEGKENEAYLDAVSIPTICYGHTSTAKIGQTLTDEQCAELLEDDLAIALKSVDTYVNVPISVETRAALTSFVFNVGSGNFRSSTLLRKLNAGDYPGACAELDRWVYAGGRKLNGLVERRKIERQICELGI